MINDDSSFSFFLLCSLELVGTGVYWILHAIAFCFEKPDAE